MKGILMILFRFMTEMIVDIYDALDHIMRDDVWL